MNNIWAVITGLLLHLINGFLYPFFHIMVLHMGYNEIPLNLVHLALMTAGTFLVIYGCIGIFWACVGTIGFLILYTISRLKNEYFEWRLK